MLYLPGLGAVQSSSEMPPMQCHRCKVKELIRLSKMVRAFACLKGWSPEMFRKL